MFVLATSRPSLNMGHVGLTSRSPGQILETYCLHSTGNISHQILILVRMFVFTISRPSSNMGHVGSKTRSLGHILENSCLHSRGQICDLILMILDQNVCLDNI